MGKFKRYIIVKMRLTVYWESKPQEICKFSVMEFEIFKTV